MMCHTFDPAILRAYDIRGTIGKNLSSKDADLLGKKLIGWLQKYQHIKTPHIVVGWDGRLSSPELKEALVASFVKYGANVTQLYLVPTPLLYFGVQHLQADMGVMITGSHNPPQDNGFKITLKEAPFYGEMIQQLAQDFDIKEQEGRSNDADLKDLYLQKILKQPHEKSKKSLKVVWDAGNGATGEVLRDLVKMLPGEHITLFTEIDGTFPNHHPDPTDAKNLKSLIKTVHENGCDLGIAFDGDGDRIGVVDHKGQILWGDQILFVLSRDLLSRKPGSIVLGDVKTSQAFFDKVRSLGGDARMSPTGHSLVKAMMKETRALLAGEMSGHIFIKDDYYGYDDALFAAVRLLSYLNSQEKTLSNIIKELPQTFSTAEMRILCDETRKFAILEELKNQLDQEGVPFNSLDGVRVNTTEGWWLLRASNTQAVLVARCESSSKDGLEKLQDELKKRLAFFSVEITS